MPMKDVDYFAAALRSIAGGRFVANQDTAHLDPHLFEPDERRAVRLLPAAAWREIDPTALRIWCARNARYGIPTTELVAWLDALIGERPALEIGAGMGDLGYHLGIAMSDSGVQASDPAVRAHYQRIGQPVTEPPPDVERLEAWDAVELLKPRVVVGCWITQRWQPGDPVGFDKGVDEAQILDAPWVETYVLVGNAAVHGERRLRKRPHACHRLPFIISRASRPEFNCVYVWDKRTGAPTP